MCVCRYGSPEAALGHYRYALQVMEEQQEEGGAAVGGGALDLIIMVGGWVTRRVSVAAAVSRC